MNRDSDGSGLVGDSSGYRLPYPPSGVSGKLVALSPVEFFHRPEQPEIAFLNQIQNGQIRASADISFGDGNNQPQVGFYQNIFSLLVAFFNSFRQIPFLGGVNQRNFADFPKIHLDGIY